MRACGPVQTFIRRSAVGPLRTLAGLRSFVACEASTVVAQAARGRARPLSRRRSSLRADCPAVLGLVARRRTRCASCARCAQTTAPSQFTRRAFARGHKPCAPRRRPFAPEPTRPQPCGQRQRVFERSNRTSAAGPGGGVPSGRMGAGEQRSAERGSPTPCARPARTRDAAPVQVDAESSQPPSRSEQRSVPSPQARAATPKPRRDTPLGPRANAAQGALAEVRNGSQAAVGSAAFILVRSASRRRKAFSNEESEASLEALHPRPHSLQHQLDRASSPRPRRSCSRRRR